MSEAEGVGIFSCYRYDLFRVRYAFTVKGNTNVLYAADTKISQG